MPAEGHQVTRPHQYTYPHGPPITRQVQEPREGMIIIGLTIRGRKIFRVHVTLPSTPLKKDHLNCLMHVKLISGCISIMNIAMGYM